MLPDICFFDSVPDLMEGLAHVLGSCLESCARMRRKLGCGLSVRDCPLLVPASFSSSTPSGSSRGLSLSSTVAEHRLALSNSTHCPASMAFVSTPSIHSNLQTHDLSSEAAFSRETASHLYIRRQIPCISLQHRLQWNSSTCARRGHGEQQSKGTGRTRHPIS